VNLGHDWRAQVDEEGRLVLPPEAAARYGLLPGAQVRLDANGDSLRLRRPVTQLAKLYVEPTNRCNLACRTCVRNVWDEPLGEMDNTTFERVLGGLRAASSPPTVFFGGFGEPLAHPDIVGMVAQTKALGSRVELITNGTLLSEPLSRELIAARLDTLWVSLDGARPESYADVRLGAALPQVLDNIARFRDARRPGLNRVPTPHIGIAFVAMRRNIADLPDLLRLGRHLGVSHYSVSNVLPYTKEMCSEVLCNGSLTQITYLPSIWVPHLNLPKIDLQADTREALYRVLRGRENVSYAGMNLGAANDRCPFIEGGSAAIGWDGGLSPCLPLLHSYTSYLGERPRLSRRYVVGNVNRTPLGELWQASEHIAFRQRVQAFDFAPCTFCGGCEMAEANQEDCFGNEFPTCGGCLWAQGVIQCP